MNKVDLTQLTSRPKGTEIALPQIQERIGTQQQYEILLKRMLSRMAQSVRNNVVPALKRFRSANDGLTFDDDIEITEYRAEAESLAFEFGTLSLGVLEDERLRHTRAFRESVRRALAIDISAVITDLDLFEYIEDYTAVTRSLINGLTEENVRNVERIVRENKFSGGSFRRIEQELRDTFDLSRKRANLIAVNETQKLTANLNQIRQEQVGITHYVWKDNDDQRVRPLHRELDGKRFKWGEPTGAEGGKPPGQPVRCRCNAIGVVTF